MNMNNAPAIFWSKVIRNVYGEVMMMSHTQFRGRIADASHANGGSSRIENPYKYSTRSLYILESRSSFIIESKALNNHHLGSASENALKMSCI
jgi:hypothetical protein